MTTATPPRQRHGCSSVFRPAIPAIRTQVLDLQANFADASAQGTVAYVDQITLDHPELPEKVAPPDAQARSGGLHKETAELNTSGGGGGQ